MKAGGKLMKEKLKGIKALLALPKLKQTGQGCHRR